jgi:hypothetical protein
MAVRMGDAIAIRRAVPSVLNLPGLSSLARKALSWVDHRPGRLYSFVCTRP